MNVPAPHSTLTKLLHLLFAAAVIHQLFISLIMVHPETNRPGDSFFELHEWVGVLTLGLVVTFWIWTLVRRGEARFGMLFPWFSGARRSCGRTSSAMWDWLCFINSRGIAFCNACSGSGKAGTRNSIDDAPICARAIVSANVIGNCKIIDRPKLMAPQRSTEA